MTNSQPGSADNSARIRDVSSDKDLRAVAGKTGQYLRVAFAPDGNTSALAHGDNAIRLWDTGVGNEFRRFAGHTNTVFAPPLWVLMFKTGNRHTDEVEPSGTTDHQEPDHGWLNLIREHYRT